MIATAEPTTAERITRAHDLLMSITSLASTLEAACHGAVDFSEHRRRKAVECIGFTVEILNGLAIDAASEIELCEEFRAQLLGGEADHAT